ncbi:hypothetical protein Tco_1548570 [Tanacetum coccineum]
MSAPMKNQMKHLNENLMMPQIMNLKKNLELNHLEKINLMKNDQQDVLQASWEQRKGSNPLPRSHHMYRPIMIGSAFYDRPLRIGCPGDRIITRRRGMIGDLCVEAIAGNGGIWSDVWTIDGSDLQSDAAEYSGEAWVL